MDNTRDREAISEDVFSAEGVASVKSGDDIERTSQILDEEVNKLRDQMPSLRIQNHLLCPVDRVPPELLARIFVELVSVQPLAYRDCSPGLKLGWIVVTHVSRRWREIALQHTVLWANVTLALGSEWMDEMLVRSKSVDLNVQIEAGLACKVSSLQPHIARTVHLRLQTEFATGLQYRDSPISQPAAMLETCHLSVTNCDHFDLPVNLFASNAPRLRVLSLKTCAISWTRLGFSSLVDLSVVYPLECEWLSQRNRTAAYRSKLLQTLSRLPSLEHLTLIRSLPSQSGTILPTSGSRPDAAVPLLSLKSLSVDGDVTDIGAFLFILQLPPTCKLKVRCGSNSSSEMRQFSPLLPDLLRFLDKPFLRLDIRAPVQSIGNYQLVLWTSTNSWADGPLLPAESEYSWYAGAQVPDLQIMFHSTVDFEDNNDNLGDDLGEESPNFRTASNARQLCADLPLESLQVLDVFDELLVWKPEIWLSLFGGLKNLRHIRVNQGPGLSLARSFSKTLGESESSIHWGPESLSFPHLATVTIMAGLDMWYSTTPNYLDVLAKALRHRKDSAAPLEGLYLQGYAKSTQQLISKYGIDKILPVFIGEDSP
ncbi:hypothetical protein DENSPDRAFT_798406 [Dentipellis sp. KUC8613]|nr:hypothetical protein DENSPDRAFT_798406 [Dentipellis sp. KUC8613]